MHASLKEAIPMESAPESHRPEHRRVLQSLRGEIDLRLFRHQIHIGKNRDPGKGVFLDLSAPTGFSPRVIPFPLLEAEVLQESYQVRKESAGRAESMMIVIAPAETEKILSPFLNPASPVLELPV